MPISLPAPCNPCPSSCGSLPEVQFSICSPIVNAGEITHVFATAGENYIINQYDASEWVYRMALPQNDPSKIVKLTVRGEKQIPEREIIEGAFKKEEYGYRYHLLSVSTGETPDDNYEFMRFFEKKKTAIIWYLTAGGKMYGGRGISAMLILDQTIPLEASSIETIGGIIRWMNSIYPCRNNSVV